MASSDDPTQPVDEDDVNDTNQHYQAHLYQLLQHAIARNNSKLRKSVIFQLVPGMCPELQPDYPDIQCGSKQCRFR